MTTKTIVILANSVKHNKHCVAGKCLTTGQWIRPVSTPEGAELSDEESTYTNPHGNYIVKPKQKIEMVLKAPVPLINQLENYLISGERWIQKYSINDNKLPSFIDQPDNLWGDGNSVSYSDIVQKQIAIEQSLYLVQVEKLRLYKKDQKNKRKASFAYRGISYDLPVTDPTFGEKLDAQDNTTGILCISLGEEFEGFCYKLVATIF